MSLERVDFESVVEDDIELLIRNGVAEGLRLEFKRQPYGPSETDRRELLKDITAISNAAGGHLVIGIDAVEGVATRLVPIPTADADAELLRMENLLRDGVEPRISGMRMRPVTAKGGAILVLRVPRSWNQPHRVSLGRTNKFYVRNSNGVHEASVEELRQMFSGSATTMDRVRELRRERCKLVAQGEGPVWLTDEGSRLLLHIVPLSAISGAASIDVREARKLHTQFSPLGTDSCGSRYNFEGVLVYRHGESCFGYTQLFRNGIVEATKGRIVVQRDQHPRSISCQKFCQDIFSRFPRYLDGLRRLGVAPPLVAMLTLEGVRDCILIESRDDLYDADPIVKDDLELPPVLIEDYLPDSDCKQLLRPALDALWNAGGRERCTLLPDDSVRV